MKEVQDRVVQFSNRYKLTNVETGEVLGTFDFDEVTGTVEQVGTEIDAELFKNFAQIDGNYPSLMAGGVQCTQLYDNADLNDCVPEKDKVFQAWVCTGNAISATMSNTPFANFGRTFYLTAVKTWYNAQDNSRFRVVQTLYSISAYGGRMIWTRSIDGAGTLGWSDWKEIVVADGSYPTLGAGYLAKTVTVATTNDSTQYGWWRFARLPFSTLTQITGTGSYSAILLVNSVNPSGIHDTNAIQSGFIELDLRLDGGKPTNINTNDVMKVLCGSLYPNLFCCNVSDTEIEFYVNLNSSFNRRNFTVLDEGYYDGEHVDALEFESTFVSSSAPSGAVYAVVRNNASADDNGYSFDTNYVWHNNGQAEKNTLKDGTTSLDFNDYLEEGKYELQGNADNPAVNFPTSSSNMSATNCDWYLVVYVRGTKYVTQVAYSVRADNAISIRSMENGKWREWRLLFEDGVAQSIPTASETIIGGVKMWVSNGKLYIKTT